MSDLRWLVIGTGDIVRKRVAAACAQAPGGKLVGICGGAPRAAEIAQANGATEVFSDIDEALRKTTANAVYIATAVFRHRAETLKALAAQKHVLVEKPLGLSGADAQAIADAAQHAGVTAACAYYRRCYPRYLHLRDLLQSGKLGQIVLVRMCNWAWFNPEKSDPKYWRVEKSKSGGGPLADVGSHMFDMLIGLLGLPRTVFARVDNLVNRYDAEDSAALLMTLSNGAPVLGHFGWDTKTWRHEMEVVGTDGKVLWFPADLGKVQVTFGRDTQEIDLPNVENVHAPLLEDFNQAVRDHRAPTCPLADAVKTNRLLDAIYQSSAQRQEVTL